MEDTWIYLIAGMSELAEKLSDAAKEFANRLFLENEDKIAAKIAELHDDAESLDIEVTKIINAAIRSSDISKYLDKVIDGFPASAISEQALVGFRKVFMSHTGLLLDNKFKVLTQPK